MLSESRLNRLTHCGSYGTGLEMLRLEIFQCMSLGKFQ